MCVISVVLALSAGVGGVWRSDAGFCECVCDACVYCVFFFVHVCMCVCLFVCVRLYLCMIIVVPALSAGLGGVWRSDDGSCECVCCACVYCVFLL